AARWRFSEARKSRRSLPASPLTTTPRTPIARARVSASASTREPITRIVPARPTSSDVERSRPCRTSPRSPPSDSRPLVGSPSASTPGIARPCARTRIPMPGRMSRTTPATGQSIGSTCSPAARVQCPPCSFTSSPASGAPPRLARAVGWAIDVQRSPGRASSPAAPSPSSTSRGSRSRSAIVVPATTVSPCVTSARSPGASRNPISMELPRTGRCATRSRPRPCGCGGAAGSTGLTLVVIGGGSSIVSSVASEPQGLLPGVEQLPAALGPVRQTERHVAQVDEEAAEAAGHVDRELPAADTEADRVAEVELRGGDLARWQVDELETTRHEVAVRGTGARVDGQGARTGPGADPRGDDDAAEWRQDVVDEVHERLAAFDRVGDHAEGAEQPGVVLGDRDGRRPADDVGEGQGDRGTGGDGEGTTGDDDEVRRR